MGSFSIFHWVIVGIIAYALYLAFRPANRTPASGPGLFALDIVGESSYQSVLSAIAGGKTEEGVRKICEATLVLDNGNRHDNKAVRVEIRGRTVGHLSRQDARRYRAGNPKKSERVPALIIGGWDRGRYDEGMFGVKLDCSLQ